MGVGEVAVAGANIRIGPVELADSGQLRLRRLHPKFGTPWIGIVIFGVISMLILLPGQATFLGNLYAFGAMLSFTVAHVAVIRLRIVDADRERPYRGPGNFRVRGYDIPGFAVDEDPSHLGESLVLPPWLEGQREAILAALPSLSLPAPVTKRTLAE